MNEIPLIMETRVTLAGNEYVGYLPEAMREAKRTGMVANLPTLLEGRLLAERRLDRYGFIGPMWNREWFSVSGEYAGRDEKGNEVVVVCHDDGHPLAQPNRLETALNAGVNLYGVDIETGGRIHEDNIGADYKGKRPDEDYLWPGEKGMRIIHEAGKFGYAFPLTDAEFADILAGKKADGGIVQVMSAHHGANEGASRMVMSRAYAQEASTILENPNMLPLASLFAARCGSYDLAQRYMDKVKQVWNCHDNQHPFGTVRHGSSFEGLDGSPQGYLLTMGVENKGPSGGYYNVFARSTNETNERSIRFDHGRFMSVEKNFMKKSLLQRW